MLATHLRLFTPLALACLAMAAPGDQVEFYGNQVPRDSGPISLYNTPGAPQRLSETVSETLSAPTRRRRRENGDSKEYLYSGNDIVGFVDRATGETRIYPDYNALKPLTSPPDLKQAFVFLEKQGGAFPPDDLQIELVEGSSLQGSDGVEPPAEGSGTVARRSNDTDATYLTLASVRRFVNVGNTKVPVCGPGSQASFGVGAENKIFSLSYRWKPAKKSSKTRTALPVEKVVQQVKETLGKKYATDGDKYIRVKTIDTCLYDSGVQHLQPVYRVFAEPYNPNSNSTAAVKQFLEYIPLGGEDAIEPILSPGQAFAGVDGDEAPLDPNTVSLSKRSFLNYFDARENKPRITVGRYLVRNDSAGFLEDARNFWSQLSPSTTYDFVRSGFYYSYPRLYNEDANSFINNVNVALTEAHGSFHGFSTYDASTSIDHVAIPSGIAPGGYGPFSNGGKGQLGYWFIDACEVMPTRTDFEAIGDPNPKRRTFDPWWPVFQGGVHAILSWRTSALFSDNTAASAAAAIALGRPVVSAWLDAAHADPAYRDRPTYTGVGTGLPNWPFGRSAAMFRCGRLGDRVNNLENLGAPTCLSVRWWNNN